MSKRKWYQKSTYLLIALALALTSGVLIVPETAASPDQATFYSSTYDGFVDFVGDNYSAVHGASSGSVRDGVTWLPVGQDGTVVPGPRFYLFRGALFFDTSSLPDDATISSAVLSLYGLSDSSGTDFNITVVDGSVLHEPLVGADYGAIRDQTVSGGAFDTAGFSTSAYNDIPLNETGVGWISKTGTTKFGLRSSRDIAATAPGKYPGTWEYVQVFTREQGTDRAPKLVVTYTTPPPPPAVGGEAYPVNKLAILAPWIAFCAAAIAGAGILLRRRGAQS